MVFSMRRFTALGFAILALFASALPWGGGDARGQTAAATSAQSHASTPGQIETVQDSDGMPPAPPAEGSEAVRLSEVEGRVQLSAASGKIFSQVRINMAVLPGMRVETLSDGRAELEFADGTVARVAPNSALELTAITRDEEGNARVALKPIKGLTYFTLAPSPAQGGASYSIAIGPVLASASGALLRVNLDQTPYQAAVLRGMVHFEDAGRNVTYDVGDNQTARIDPQSATSYDIAMEATPDTWDTWNAGRDAELAQIASTRPVTDEPGGPGWSDLDYYGSWYDIPGQGMAWAPDGVDRSFDPYGDGAWGYYSGVGYSWASSYPWGWLPYHCGAWNYFGGYGWMWQPRNCGWGYGGGWFPYSGVYGLPGYRLPPRPVHARGITHLPPSQAVLPVRRGAPIRFRALGEPRPTVRTPVVAGQTLQAVPVESRPSYATVQPAGPGGLVNTTRLRTSQGRIGAHPSTYQSQPSQPGSPGYGTTMRAVMPPPSGTVPLAPRFVPGPAPAPRMSPGPAPAPRMSAPAPPPAFQEAPHGAPPPPAAHH